MGLGRTGIIGAPLAFTITGKEYAFLGPNEPILALIATVFVRPSVWSLSKAEHQYLQRTNTNNGLTAINGASRS